MKVLIVEDEKLAVRKLTKLLEETAPELMVKGVTPSIEATVEWLLENRGKREKEPDIIFMDIELADGQSFEIFNRVEIKSTVIFTTSYDEYALQAFKVNSIDYLLKPVQKEDLQRSLKKYYDLKGPEKNEEPGFLPTSLENILKNLQLKQSFFKNHAGQKFVVDYRLDELAEFLNPKHFLRINRSIIITHGSVVQIQPYYNNRLALTLKPSFDKEAIVSREKTNDFKIWMGK
jgi:two-component system response regulator LytT